MITIVPDNYSAYEAHEDRIAAEQKGRPICAWCDSPVMYDHFYNIEGEVVCPECMEEWLLVHRVDEGEW